MLELFCLLAALFVDVFVLCQNGSKISSWFFVDLILLFGKKTVPCLDLNNQYYYIFDPSSSLYFPSFFIFFLCQNLSHAITLLGTRKRLNMSF